MKFVLVSDRAPRRGATCAHCRKPITIGYLRDLYSQLPYCDHACFVGRNTNIMPTTFRLGAGIDSLPFRSLSGW
jgi:hypothetical protein